MRARGSSAGPPRKSGNLKMSESAADKRAREHGQQAAILRARLAGQTLEAIAEAHGITKQRVAQVLQKALARPKTETAALARELELARLDFLTEFYWPAPGTPADQVWFDKLMELSEKRAKLLGLNAPEKFEVRTQQYILDWGEEDHATDGDDAETP